MLEKVTKIPGPDHPITIEKNPNRIVVTVGGNVTVLAHGTTALAAKYKGG